MSRRSGFCFSAVAAAALLAACAAGPAIEAQWTDPQLGTQSAFLRGARVLVACDTADVTLRQICQDRLAAEVTARGGTPVFLRMETQILTDRSMDSQLLPSARAEGAKALLVMTVAPAATHVSQPFHIGIGGFGYGGGGGSMGVGVSAPVGGGQVTTGFAGNGRVTDVGSGRMVWSVRATTPPSADLNAQLAELSRQVVGAAQQSGLF